MLPIVSSAPASTRCSTSHRKCSRCRSAPPCTTWTSRSNCKSSCTTSTTAPVRAAGDCCTRSASRRLVLAGRRECEATMALISVGIDHENASLDLLERATVLEHEWSKVLRSLLSQRNIHEAVFVSTCLRTEVVAVIDRFHGAIDEITHTLSEATGLDPSEFADHLSVHFDRGVATHLFSVAAGLKSVVPGEFEILGQLRRALELATEEQTAGPEITELFQRAISTGRRVRSETQIARGTTSFAQASVMMATDDLGVDLEGADVLIIGAGQLAGGIARSLLARPARLARLTIANRTASTCLLYTSPS